ncbi:sentrin-specific protease 6 isoform X3 [Oryzias latipes]|uniref:sentrin-specific protease 6 isoform X3 n=1 Tax=Oryzias latipes TaxID=8090 RepID=UPI0009DA98C0|nr:sentrin-specific protease 6 isoform X3 [Oryzias latipes]
MAHNRSFFLEALDRSETRRDGGFKHSWSFSPPSDSDEEKLNDASVISVKEMQQPTSPDEKKSPSLRHFSSSNSIRTYEKRTNNHMRPLNKLTPKRISSDVPLAAATPSPTHNGASYYVFTPPPQGIFLQGRHFQHAQLPSAVKKPVQRNDFSPSQQNVEVDSIVLTCQESPEEETLNIKRRILQRRKPLDVSNSSTPVKQAEAPQSTVYYAVCLKCNKPSEDSTKCHNCRSSASLIPSQPATLSSLTPRPPIRPQTSRSPNSLQQSFCKPGTTIKIPGGEAVPVRATSMLGSQLPSDDGASAVLGRASGKRTAAVKQHQLNDPIVLSSDEEEDEADNASTGSVNRLDSVSPRPADSAHSSPVPSGGRGEAEVKSTEAQEEIGSEFFEDVNIKITIPRRARMKDQFGNQPPEQLPPRTKKPKVASNRCDSIILECRSIRIGSLRRMVKKPVVFSIDHIQLETQGPVNDSIEKVCLQTSEIILCEWCCVRKLPVLFFQTTPKECLRLRTQLNMSKENGGHWYDCDGNASDEKYIVLIFENGLALKEQIILEDILTAIGTTNNLSDFPTKLTFDEANVRLVNYNKSSSQKSEKEKSVQNSPNFTHVPSVSPVSIAGRTRMATRQTRSYFEDEDEDMTDLPPSFSGPIVKLMVYPPPPAKGGITVTNEDLHCLNDGEFLNDVIIDFYLKYLVLEKLKKDDAQRIHVFSSFFYKRLNQRERRNATDTTSLPIQKRKHNRVKTWTRHVDLFQKDFIFVPINESAHWYLAVICFPGLEGPVFDKNPLYCGPTPASGSVADFQSEDSIPDHCRPLSPDGDCLDSPSEFESSEAPGGSAEGQSNLNPENFAEDAQESLGNSQAEPEQHYSSELHRISLCYGSGKEDDTYTFSDDQSSCQDECSEDGTLAEDGVPSDVSSLASKPTILKQPCILIMDSLRGPTRSTVVKTLREYLEVEWEVRKGTQRSFSKEVMKGSSPCVPQQDNFSDCGVYVLQYVESFFENPPPRFHLPMNLSEWFPQQRMKTKREEIKELILTLQEQQELNLESKQEGTPLGSSEEPDVQETSELKGKVSKMVISP